MAGSSDVVANNQILATDYNKLRADVLDSATGHDHEDPDGKRLAKNALRFTDQKLLLGAGAAEPTEVSLPAETPIASGTYTGNDTVNRAIPHGLGVTPKIVFIHEAVLGDIWFRITDLRASLNWGNIEAATAGTFVVTIPNGTNFYVGNVSGYDRSANSNTVVYDWVAIGG